MDPNSGDVFRLREELTGEAEPGDLLDRERYRALVAELDNATADEVRAAESERLVAVSEQAAQRLILGQRERERRRKRRKSSAAARRRNR